LVAGVTSKSTAYHSHLRRNIRFHLDIHVHVTFIFIFIFMFSFIFMFIFICVFVLSFTFIFIFSGAPQKSSSSYSHSGSASSSLSFLNVHRGQDDCDVGAFLVSSLRPGRRQADAIPGNRGPLADDQHWERVGRVRRHDEAAPRQRPGLALMQAADVFFEMLVDLQKFLASEYESLPMNAEFEEGTRPLFPGDLRPRRL
jgi:hypothetical protein